MANSGWFNIFLEAKLANLVALVLDYYLNLLNCNPVQRPHSSKRTFRFENAYKLETGFDIWLRRVGKGTWIDMCFIDYICAHKPCLLGAGNIVIRRNSKTRIVVASWIILVALVHGRIGFKCGFYERG